MIKSGFVAIIGRPNAGKSTLLNNLLQQKVAIISDKPQTTRNVIVGVYNQPDCQIVFIDTPGIHKPHHQLGKQMNKAAYSQASGVDLIYYIVDASVAFGSGDEFVLNKLKEFGLPVFLLINKIDLFSKETLYNLIVSMKNRFDFQEIVPISALTSENLSRLINVTKQNLKIGPAYYPVDKNCDYPEQFVMSEIIREKVLILTKEEIPHCVAVVIENIRKKRETLYIQAMILVERNSQKGIIIGDKGQMISRIGKMAREELEGIFGNRIYLELFVRVEKDWRNRENKLQQLGYITVKID